LRASRMIAVRSVGAAETSTTVHPEGTITSMVSPSASARCWKAATRTCAPPRERRPRERGGTLPVPLRIAMNTNSPDVVSWLWSRIDVANGARHECAADASQCRGDYVLRWIPLTRHHIDPATRCRVSPRPGARPSEWRALRQRCRLPQNCSERLMT
jgi:hypothetical protein